MAIEAAVVHVVRAIQPGEQLQEEPGLVRGASAEVPERFVRREVLQLGDNASKSVLPSDRFVVLRSTTVDDWLDQSSTGFQIARRESLELRDRVGAPELRLDGALQV